MASRIERERVKRQLAQIMDKIQTEADPLLLNEYRSLIKKEVSFFRRSYVGAYLLMLSDQNGAGRSASGRDNRGGRANGPSGKNSGDQNPRSNRSRKSSGADSADSPRPERSDRSEPREPKVYPLAEEESVRLFISVGRSRRVFPREILGLINAKTDIPRDDIGAIRILDNYSFVQVRTTVADTIIEALNGQTFRGRPLSVNYARSRNEAKADDPDIKDINDIQDTRPRADNDAVQDDFGQGADQADDEPDSFGDDVDQDSMGNDAARDLSMDDRDDLSGSEDSTQDEDDHSDEEGV